jgi:acetyl esterase/lipase
MMILSHFAYAQNASRLAHAAICSQAMTRIVFLSTILLAGAAAQPGSPIPLWNGHPPGGTTGPERDTTTEKDALVAGRRVMRIGGIAEPSLIVYPAPKNGNTGRGVLVFPGGGYRILAWDLEGTEVCEWLNRIGITGVLVKYRVPAPAGVAQYAPALQDAQRAMGIVRARAREWGLDPKQIGVLGFSAGAHLSAALSASAEKRTYDRVDASDDIDCRPNFAVLIYPGLIVPRNGGDKLQPEIAVTDRTPPTILVQTEDDPVRVENSLAYYTALKTAKVPVEMHLYPTGGHGYGLRPSEHLVTTWPARVEEWMRKLK